MMSSSFLRRLWASKLHDVLLVYRGKEMCRSKKQRMTPTIRRKRKVSDLVGGTMGAAKQDQRTRENRINEASPALPRQSSLLVSYLPAVEPISISRTSPPRHHGCPCPEARSCLHRGGRRRWSLPGGFFVPVPWQMVSWDASFRHQLIHFAREGLSFSSTPCEYFYNRD